MRRSPPHRPIPMPTKPSTPVITDEQRELIRLRDEVASLRDRLADAVQGQDHVQSQLDKLQHSCREQSQVNTFSHDRDFQTNAVDTATTLLLQSLERQEDAQLRLEQERRELGMRYALFGNRIPGIAINLDL